MPFTFSAGSFSFLKSSTTSQSNIKQNNNVDNVNNNNINNTVNDNLDMGKNQHPSLNNNTTVNAIPLVRRVRSLDNSAPKSNRRASNASNLKNTNNRKAWYKSLFVRIHQTLSRLNDDDGNNNNNDINNDHDYDINNTVMNNNVVNDGSGVESISDDDPKSKNVVGSEKFSFICHGNTHDFYVETKNGSMPKCSIPKWSMSNSSTSNSPMSNDPISNGPISISMSNGPISVSMSNGPLSNDSLKPSPNFISSSVFEECAKTPRHFAKEPEVLGKVGRFTIVREREDFDTTYFDQCHCQQKPCRFSSTGCSGAHPVLPPEDENDRPPTRHLTQQQVISVSHHSCSNKNDSWPSSKSSRSFYCNNTPSSNSSRNSLPSLQQQKYNLNGSYLAPIPVSKVTTPNLPSSNSSVSRVILPQSSSSPNLVHLNHRSKIENKNISKNIIGHPNPNVIVVGNSGKYPNPPTNNNGSYYPQCNNYSTAVIKKSKKPSLVNMKTTEEQQRRLSMPPTPTTPTTYQPLNLNSSSSNPSTPTYPSKFSLHHPNEPHTTINSHSGRKFEVEWNTTSKSSSSSSASSTTSSDTAYSPPSTISSVFSMASSPDKKSTINSTLSRRCSTLSSKCGRKFEVTILSSSSSSNNCILNTSPHSTIGSVNSIIVDVANTDSTKC